ncbi:dna-directed rna polymerases i ii and iii subunit rpabc2 [Holotrichia oblita]|uniref:Dna-directed rna polymerases i ii and iii subunit rpabc2 n=1 Tax=Holotrichia oblita TaxID=644536 RepID=A0ACB9TY04_HOLOL|nr:dna-directed rna polymerases i ii and iii subunit rpabc2 [Holotrichia oblita]
MRYGRAHLEEVKEPTTEQGKNLEFETAKQTSRCRGRLCALDERLINEEFVEEGVRRMVDKVQKRRKTVRYWNCGEVGSQDSAKRRRPSPGNKLSEDVKLFIVEHINAFARVPSHYCRKESLKQYLPGDLNVQIMYRMYKERCRELNKKPEKLWYYRNIFNTNFNLAFYSPRRDICDKCFTHGNKTSAEEAFKSRRT